MKLIEVQAAKDFASTFLNDIFFKMAVNRVLDNAPGFNLVHCKACKHYDSGHGVCEKHTEVNAVWMGADDFCSKGERKNNE